MVNPMVNPLPILVDPKALPRPPAFKHECPSLLLVLLIRTSADWNTVGIRKNIGKYWWKYRKIVNMKNLLGMIITSIAPLLIVKYWRGLWIRLHVANWQTGACNTKTSIARGAQTQPKPSWDLKMPKFLWNPLLAANQNLKRVSMPEHTRVTHSDSQSCEDLTRNLDIGMPQKLDPKKTYAILTFFPWKQL